MIWPRILLAVVSVLIAIWFFRFAFTAQRKFRLIWLLPACLWVLSCLTLVFNPIPPKDITDVTQWQGIWLLVEAGIRIVVSIISLIVFVIYRTSEVSPGLIKNENDK